MNGDNIQQPTSWAVHKRLLERSGRMAWLIDSDGMVVWANDEARRLQPGLSDPGIVLADKVVGFIPGGSAALDHGTLVCEEVEGGWAVFLEASGPLFAANELLDLLPVAIFWKDRAGIYRGCNHAFTELMGGTAGGLIGKSVFEVFSPALAAKYHAMDEELMTAGPDGVQRYEWRLSSNHGAERAVQFHKANLTDADGNVAGLVGMVLDITELRRIERKFATVFKACPDPITITEAETGRYIDVNDAFFTTTGWTRDEVLGRTSLDLGIWVDTEERTALLAALKELGHLTNFETRFRRKDGSIFTALASVEPTELDKVPCLIMVARDISARKHEELVLRRTADELHRSNLELERFAYVAAHDLQEPCRTICSFAQLLERRCGEALGEDGREYLSYLSAGAQRMRELISGLLRYSRVDSNSLRFEDVDLAAVMQSTLGDLSGALDQTGAVVCVGALPQVRGDAMQIHQVLINLIGNALKFQPPGQTPRVEVAARLSEDSWLLTVRDNGIGIAPEYADEIFGMFRRLHGGGAYPGTGIGLALVRRIVEAHGGRVWVESAPGKGSLFCLTLPA